MECEEPLVFSDAELSKIARIFKILSQRSRLIILRTLFSGEKCVSDIVTSTGLLQANVSKQLTHLADNGIIICRAKGLQRIYRISDDTVYKICKLICSEK